MVQSQRFHNLIYIVPMHCPVCPVAKPQQLKIHLFVFQMKL